MAIPRPALSGLVLAGGASKRMGASKPWLDVGGQSALSRVAGLAAQMCASVIVVARPAQTLPPLSPAHVVARDAAEHEGRGPLAGIAAGLARVETPYCLLLSCDAIGVDQACVERLLAEPVGSSAAFDALAVRVAGSRRAYHLSPSMVRVDEARTAATNLLRSGEGRVSSLFDALRTRALDEGDFPSPEAFWPANTPEEWARLVDRLPRGGAGG